MTNTLTRGVGPLLAVVAVGCAPTRTGERSRASSEIEFAPSPAIQTTARKHRYHVRVIHAVPGAPPVDVRTGRDPLFSAVNFRTVTEYRPVETDRPRFTILPAGASRAEPLAEHEGPVPGGRRYTIVAMADGNDIGIEVEALRDDAASPSPGRAVIRVINAAPRVHELDIHVEAEHEPLFSDVQFREESGFTEIEPGVVSFLVTVKRGRRVVLRLPNVVVAAGQRLTMVLTHPSASSAQLEAIWIRDHISGGSES